MNYKQLGRQIERQIENEVKKIADDIADKAKQLYPSVTGELRDSIRVDAHGTHAEVVVDSDYAVDVEFGNHDQAAEPGLRPATDGEARNFRDHIIDAMNRAIPG